MTDSTDALHAAVAACQHSNAEYAVIGAVARNAWAPPRATSDLDLAISVSPSQYHELLRLLAASGFVPEQTISAEPTDAVPDVVLLRRGSGTVRRLDLLVAKSEFEKEAIAEAVVVDVGVPCRIVRPEHLIVYKLIAGRPRDLGDAEDIARTQALGSTPLDMVLIRRWAVEWEIEDRLERLEDSLFRQPR